MNTPSGVAPAVTLLALALASPALQAQTPAEDRPDTAAEAPVITSATTTSVSEVRIVRLSEIRGEAQLDRNTGNGFEAAFANLPIVQHARLRTAEGVVEVEFEDNSSLRLTPDTVIDFPQLGRTSTGATLSTIHVLKGTVYVSLSNTKSKTAPNQFTVTFGPQTDLQTLILAPSSHIELSLNAPAGKLAVFDGSVNVQHGANTITVAKKKELVFNPGSPTAPTQLTKVEKGPFDQWDKDQADYHQRYANAAFGLSSSYGTSDLNYYGSFADLPGCGNVWRPYFTSAAWDPFSNGTWAYYPGAGYSWVSPYPWGWTPFHYGSWQQCGANGWGWQPGGQWVGLRNGNQRPTNLHSPAHNPTGGKPPLPPAPGHPTLIPVNTRPLSVSRIASPDTFVFSKDSAGLGVPRQTFGKLSSASNDVAHHGAVLREVVSAPTPLPQSNTQSNPHAASDLSGNGSGSATSAHTSNTGNAHSTINGFTPAVHTGGTYNDPSAHATYTNSGAGAWSGNSHAPTAAPAASAPSAPAASAPSAPSAAGSSHH